MKKTWIKTSTKGVLFVALLIVVFLSGRISLEREANSGNAIALELARRVSQTSLSAAVWRKIALEYRDDIRQSEQEWSMHSIKRVGGGGSFVRSSNSEDIRPRAKRWKFSLSNDPAIATEQLKSVKSSIVCVWDEPARLELWDSQSAQFREIDPNLGLEKWIVLAADEEVFSMLPDSVFNDKPRYVLLAIPNDVENQLTILEYQQFKIESIDIREVATTTFGFSDTGGSFEVMIAKHTLKSTP